MSRHDDCRPTATTAAKNKAAGAVACTGQDTHRLFATTFFLSPRYHPQPKATEQLTTQTSDSVEQEALLLQQDCATHFVTCNN